MSLNHNNRVSIICVSCDELVITTMHNYLPTIALLAVQWGYLNSYSADEKCERDYNILLRIR